jgi:hypothetical protein
MAAARSAFRFSEEILPTQCIGICVSEAIGTSFLMQECSAMVRRFLSSSISSPNPRVGIIFE